MRKRARPRSLSSALRTVRDQAAPPTLLAAVQTAWPEVTGPAIADEATPVGERDGIISVACRSSVWAQELDLMAPRLLERLNERLDAHVAGLRFTADASRHDPP